MYSKNNHLGEIRVSGSIVSELVFQFPLDRSVTLRIENYQLPADHSLEFSIGSKRCKLSVKFLAQLFDLDRCVDKSLISGSLLFQKRTDDRIDFLPKIATDEFEGGEFRLVSRRCPLVLKNTLALRGGGRGEDVDCSSEWTFGFSRRLLRWWQKLLKFAVYRQLRKAI